MEKTNYQLLLDEKLKALTTAGERPSLLLHCCCAPCSSYVLEYLAEHFDITCYFYNPNISLAEEYEKRAAELLSLIDRMGLSDRVGHHIKEYAPEPFEKLALGREQLPEGGERCFECYRLRLTDTVVYAKAHGFELFTTTLSVSPYKNASKLNELGAALADEYSVPYLFSDFKKRNGYLRSCRLSEQYGLYRQDYCGCVYSKAASEKKRACASEQNSSK